MGSSGHFELLVPYPDSKAMTDFWGCQVGPTISKKVKKSSKMVKIRSKSLGPFDFFQKQPPPRGFVPFPVDSLIPRGDFDLLVPWSDLKAMTEFRGPEVGLAISKKKWPKWSKKGQNWT